MLCFVFLGGGGGSHIHATCELWLPRQYACAGASQGISLFQAKFEFQHGDYEKQCLHALTRKDKAGMIMNNPAQSVFLFMDRHHLQVSYDRREASNFFLSGVGGLI